MEFQLKYDYDLGDEERQAALQVLQEDVFATPEQGPALEKEFAQFIGTKYGVATSSGTSALHCCVAALEIGAGDEVITPCNQHTAPSYTIMLTGAKPVYVDIDEETFTDDPSEVERAITPKTKALLPVHSGGHPYNVDPIHEIAEKHGLPVIEDAAQSLGAKYREKLVGTFGTVAVFSMARHKHIMGAGQGGIAVTNDGELAEKLRRWRTSRYRTGITSSTDPVVQSLNYQGAAPGFSYYLSEVHAAIIRVQLKKFTHPDGPLNPKRKRANAQLYKELLEELSFVKTPVEKDWAWHTYLRYIVRVPKRDALYKYLTQEKGIEVFVHYPVPLHRSKFFIDAFGPSDRQFPKTEMTARDVLTLPSWPQLTADQIQSVVDAIKEFYQVQGQK